MAEKPVKQVKNENDKQDCNNNRTVNEVGFIVVAISSIVDEIIKKLIHYLPPLKKQNERIIAGTVTKKENARSVGIR